MMKNLLKNLLAGAALLVGSSAFAQAPVTRYSASITGYDREGAPVTVSTTVYDSFDFTVQMPGINNAIVSTEKADVRVELNDVTTLGMINETRVHEVTVNTGVRGVYPNLTEMLSSIYAFEGATCPVTVIDNGVKSEGLVYNIAAYDARANQLVGTVNSLDYAYGNWCQINSHVSTSANLGGDSYVCIPKGSYLQIGNEAIYFDNETTIVPGSGNHSMKEILNAIFENSRVQTMTRDMSDTYKAVISMRAGTAMAVGATKSVLTADAKITIDLSGLSDVFPNGMTGMVSQALYPVYTASDMAYTGLFTFVNMYNQLVAMVDAAENVPVTVEFTPVAPKFDVYPGSSEVQAGLSLSELEALQASFPNTMAVLTFGEAPAGVKNVLVAQPNGSYCVANFVLTDLTPDYTTTVTAPKTNFYSPVDFVAVSGNYSRDLSNGYNSLCLPFAISTDIEGVDDILTYNYYDGNVMAYFDSNDEIGAGVPCVVMSDGTKMSVEFDNTPIVCEAGVDGYTYGTFATTSAFKGFYGVNTSTNKFSPLSNNLYPFRACIDMIGTNGENEIKIARLSEITSINSVVTSASNDIYNVNGVKVSQISKPGLYVVNGKKMYVK